MVDSVWGYADKYGKNSSNKFEILVMGKKRHIGEGADGGLAWLIAGRGMRIIMGKK